MAQHVKLNLDLLKEIRTFNPRLMSYNVEMTEVTGGTFWKEFTPGQIAGTEPFTVDPNAKSYAEITKSMVQWYNPVDLTNPRLRKLAKELGSCWVRVSGTWATKTYYDLDGKMNGKAPEGFENVLTREQWLGVLDFVKAVNGRLLISVANCAGQHSAHEPLPMDEAKKIFELSKEYGVPIEAAEFMNEPNMLVSSGAPEGYTATDYARDQDIFFGWVKENYPECLLVGPCGGYGTSESMKKASGGGIQTMFSICTNDDLLEGTKVPMDVYSYHIYAGISERMAPVMPSRHWGAAKALNEEYLDFPINGARISTPARDQHVPGGEMWVTETADSGAGGSSWASTYLDVPRTLNELAGFVTVTDGVLFHNTLCSSDYGYLRHSTFEPRPNYFAVKLWQDLVGNTVYDSGIPVEQGKHVYCHSRKDGKEGFVYLVINNSWTDTTTVELPKDAVKYALDGNGDMRSTVLYLNGKPLTLGENDELPDLSGEPVPAGSVEVVPGGCVFFVL